MVKLYLPSEQATIEFGEKFATILDYPLNCNLQGALGMGKTTLVQSIVRANGVLGKITSPTFTLMETYHCSGYDILHIDLYRVSDPQELEYTGILENITTTTITFIEWPQNGTGYFPPADLIIEFKQQAEGRELIIEGKTRQGNLVTGQLNTEQFEKFTLFE